MKIITLLKTVYVFDNKKLAVLKKQSDITLKLTSSEIERNELTQFLQNNGYEIVC